MTKYRKVLLIRMDNIGYYMFVEDAPILLDGGHTDIGR